jgi:acyl dehydratase
MEIQGRKIPKPSFRIVFFFKMVLFLLALTAAVPAAVAFALSRSHASNIFRATGSQTGRLSFRPTHLSGVDIFILFLLVILKYANKLIGRLPALKVTSNGQYFALPLVTLSAPLHVDHSDLELFAKAVESGETTFGDGNVSPLLLPAITTPLLLILLSNRGCPVLPFGAVNTKNRFEYLDSAACRSVASIKDLTVTGRLGGDDLLGRRVKRGMEFEIVIEVEGQSDAVHERKIIFRQIIGILVFLPKRAKPTWESGRDIPGPQESMRLSNALPQQLQLSSNTPVKWAALCKDVNPIHMSSLAAKTFGFPGKIAHGNHVVARVIQKQIDVNTFQDPSRSILWRSEKPWFLSIDFKRPMVLPTMLDVKFTVEEKVANRSKYGFEVVRGEKVHVSGVYGEL